MARRLQPFLAQQSFSLVLTSPLTSPTATYFGFWVLVARWIGLPATAGRHFLLDTATLNILGYHRISPAVKN